MEPLVLSVYWPWCQLRTPVMQLGLDAAYVSHQSKSQDEGRYVLYWECGAR